MMKKVTQRIVILVSAVVATALLLAAAAGGIFFYLNAPPDKAFRPTDGISVTAEGEARIEVREGESAGSVGQRLEDALLIRSAFLWNILSRLDEDHIRQGVYVVAEPLSLTATRALLKTGRQEMVRITVPEGVTISKTARILESGGICTADEFLAAASDPEFLAEYHIPADSAEGYLFPDTYLFPRGYPAHLAAKTMADNFFEHLAETRGPGERESAAETHRKITLASIVEREYRVNDEAPMMAGVFYNRLERGMRLQSCATVEYIITEIEGKPHPTRIFFRDLEIQNPYNTYKVSGLPPGPISAPGQIALDAVYHPVATDYLYFRLADANAGRHTFSRTLEDHNNAVVFYTKAGAGQ
ncbi:MAG: endolytic transglycosylase MltG [Spirochaetaceae bacterium]|jgi:UPF0755 protein|nr:endolytic transglycosylase MltG [Spirochaetaceae bacterium]